MGKYGDRTGWYQQADRKDFKFFSSMEIPGSSRGNFPHLGPRPRWQPMSSRREAKEPNNPRARVKQNSKYPHEPKHENAEILWNNN